MNIYFSNNEFFLFKKNYLSINTNLNMQKRFINSIEYQNF